LAKRSLPAIFLFPPALFARGRHRCARLKSLGRPDKSGIAARDDLEVFQESKLLIQEPNRPGPSRRVSQVLNDSESVDPQKTYNFRIVHTSVGAVFRQVTRADKLAAEQGIYPREGF
jgi:hypothetical protein